MAQLVSKNVEQNPWNEAGSARFAYFKGTPTPLDLLKAGVDFEYGPGERVDNDLARQTGLQRWFLGQND